MILRGVKQENLKRIAIMLVCISLFGCSLHPSDDSLISNFKSKRDQFEQLIKMFISDQRLYAVTIKEPAAEDSAKTMITSSRREEYKTILKNIGANEISGNDLKDVIRIEVSFRGGILNGSAKGYVYDENVCNNSEYVVDNIDSFRREDGRSFIIYRHIEGYWYLYLEE